jgi:hypothetical protein
MPRIYKYYFKLTLYLIHDRTFTFSVGIENNDGRTKEQWAKGFLKWWRYEEGDEEEFIYDDNDKIVVIPRKIIDYFTLERTDSL